LLRGDARRNRRALRCLTIAVILAWGAAGRGQMGGGPPPGGPGGGPPRPPISRGRRGARKRRVQWTDGKTSETFSSNFLFAFGASDGTNSRSVGTASQNNVDPSNATRRLARKALTIVQWGETLLAESDLSSWNATNFTLNWTTNNSTAYRIHFIAIGGTDVSAKVVEWTMPNSTGLDAVTGVGFQPDALIHFHAGGALGIPPVTEARGAFGLGAMVADGTQWANEVLIVDAADMRAAPGVWTRFTTGDATLQPADFHERLTVHYAGLAEALALGDALGVLPPEIVIYGIQPLTLEWSPGLSKPRLKRAGQTNFFKGF
jgi:hydrogenase maturation protease